jgi:hypothetical protein
VQKRPITNILKSRPKRTVYRELESASDQVPYVVKRFHAPGVLQSLRDGLRAHREAHGLRRWRALGLPAPNPVAVRHRAGHWELVLEAVQDAQPLPDFLAQHRHDAKRLKHVATTVGALLARVDSSRAHHGDPHPGNLLIDIQDKLWLIDPTPQPFFSRRATPGWPRWVRFCGQIRESSTPLFRAQVCAAYIDAGGPSPPPSHASDRQKLEMEARDWRYKEIQVRSARWLRTSGATQVEGTTIHRLSPAEGKTSKQTFASHDQARSQWLACARLIEHAIPCTPVKALDLGSMPAIEWVVLPGRNAYDESKDPSALGWLLARLHDRGLALTHLNPQDLQVDAEGTMYLDSPGMQVTNGPATPWMTPEFPAWVPRSDPRFVEAFVAGLSATRKQIQELRSALLGV